MAVGDDDIIDEAVVEIRPELAGFGRPLQAKVDAALKRIEGRIKVIADATDTFGGLTRNPVRDRNYILRLQQRQIAENLRRTRNANEQVQRMQQQAERAYAQQRQRADEAYTTFRRKVADELHRIDADRAADEVRIREETNRSKASIDRAGSRLRIALLAAEERAQRETARRTEAAERAALIRSRNRRQAFGQLGDLTQSRIIDFGGRGIRPMNLLYAAAAALSPLLVSLASSATLASTSIAALGAAGIGAAAGITGLVVAFGGIREALKLRETVGKQQLKQQAAEVDNTGAILDAQDRLIDARERLYRSMRSETEAQQGINEARREAARDLENLRRKVEDLRNQERSDRLSVAEAKAERDATVRNFFTSALERQRAQQDVADAENRLANTRLDRRQTGQDYAIALPKGVEGSDRVRDAREALRDAIADRQRAQRELVDGLRDLAAARNRTTATGVAATQAMSELEEKLREMSPAAREMYYWFEANEGMLKRLARGIEQRVLPGFTQFLRDVSDRSKGASALDMFADAAGRLGSKFSDLARDAGKIVKQEWFRDSFAEIIQSNSNAMDSMRRATTKLVKPFMQIFEASSPLLERFAGFIERIAGRFASFIDKAERTGDLDRWFKRAGDEMARWGSLLGEILRFFKGIFTASMPSGTTLLDRLTTFFRGLADWSNSPQGQKSVRDFFNRIANLPFRQIAEFAGKLTALFLTAYTAKWALMNPFWSGIGMLIAANPTAALSLINQLMAVTNFLLDKIVKHPESAALFLGILTAAKGAKALKVAMDIPGISNLKGWLTSKFKPLETLLGGGTKTGVMTVHAGVVNIMGAAGTPAIDPDTGKPTKGKNKLLNGVEAVGVTNVVAAAVLAGGWLGWEQFQRGLGKGEKRAYVGFTDLFKSPSWGTLINYAVDNSMVSLLTALGKKWAPNIRRFFAMDMPNFVTGRNDGWSGMLPWLAQQLNGYASGQTFLGILDWFSGGWATRLYAKVDAWVGGVVQRVKDVLGIKSPSTVFMEIGRNIIDGFWAGLTSTWNTIATPALEWVRRNVVNPLGGLFGNVGTTANELITAGIKGLIPALATPTKTVFDWIDRNLIGKLNPLLTSLGVPVIKNIGFDLGASIPGVIGKMPKLAAGGAVPGWSPNDRADNIPAMLTANEFVQPVDAVKHYGVDFMEAVRTKRLPRYADGGLIAGLASQRGLAAQIASAAMKSIRDMTAEELAERIATQLYPADPGFDGPIPMPGDGRAPSNWRSQWAAIKARFPKAQLFSGLRRTRTGSGAWSRHAFGKAVDVSPWRAIAQWIHSSYGGRAYELITPWRELDLWRGKPHRYSDTLHRQHQDHVHWSVYGKGGRVRKYDTGGTLPPGFTLAYNGTGRSETVRTYQQERNLQQRQPADGPTRLDRRDLALLASYITAASAPVVQMDGRKVAEITNRYTNLPAGV